MLGMPRTKRGSEETRERIVRGSGRGFRSHGYGGVGVDALAHESGVTSGAFYGHFRSKAEAFREALTAGLEELRDGIETVRSEAGDEWQARFTDFYLGERRTCDLAESCALQSLSVEAARADDDARAAYEAEWIRIRDVAAAGFPNAPSAEEQRELATGLLALLAGGVSIARAVRRPEVSEGIAKAVRKLALAIGASPGATHGRAKKASTGGGAGAASKPPLNALANARPPLPPFTLDEAIEKARLAEDAWNTRDPARVALAYTMDTRWRNRAEFVRGRPDVVRFLERKWSRELDYRLIKEVWAAHDNRIAVRFVYEWRDDSRTWFRSHGNEQWEFDETGLMARREASINDVPIEEVARLFRWPLGPRPVKHPGLTELGL